MEVKHFQQPDSGKFDMIDGDDKVAEMTYVYDEDGDMIINHTYVRHKYRDRGLGNNLLDHVVRYVRDKAIKIIPKCPFVKSVFSDSDQYDDIWKK